jgi:hypothetical protein
MFTSTHKLSEPPLLYTNQCLDTYTMCPVEGANYMCVLVNATKFRNVSRFVRETTEIVSPDLDQRFPKF